MTSKILFITGSTVYSLYFSDTTTSGDKNNSVLMNSLQIHENKAAKLIVDAPPLPSATEALKLLNWTPFSLGIRRHKHRCIFIFKCINVLIDFDFKLTTNNNIHCHNTHFGLLITSHSLPSSMIADCESFCS